MTNFRTIITAAVGAVVVALDASASDSVSGQWNRAWSGQDAAARAVLIQQANAIALRQSDYYNSFGPANVSSTSNTTSYIANQTTSSYSTTSVGSVNTTNSSVNGSDNSITSNSSTSNSGSMQSTLR